MPWPWTAAMGWRSQDRLIRRYLDGSIDNLIFASYGGMTNSAPTGNYSFGAGWTKFADFDQSLVDPPRGIILDLPNNRLAFDIQGIYAVNISFVFNHNESNQGRTFYVRSFNETDGVAGPQIPIGVGRNTPVTNYTDLSLFVVETAEVDDFWSLEFGGGSSINGTFEDMEIWAASVSEIQEQVPSNLSVTTSPQDSQPYVAVNGQWVSLAIFLSSFFSDCPDDGQLYVRRHGEWVTFEDAEEEVDD